MKKSLIIGIATLAVTGSALVASSMYAATSTSTTTSGTTTQGNHQKGQFNPQDMISSLSGKVSPDALTALQTLMTNHKSQMDALKANTSTTQTQIEALHTEFKTQMDALMTQYPELKSAMEANRPAGGKGDRGGPDHAQVDAIIATLPSNVQTELKSIRDSYKTKQDALRTEERTKIDTVLSAYPAVKAKLDALRPANNGKGPGPFGGSGSVQAQ